jgi:hypothetical protein
MSSKPESERRFVFYIELEDGTEMRWSPLTMTQAKNMHSLTERFGPMEAKRFGWEEIK